MLKVVGVLAGDIEMVILMVILMVTLIVGVLAGDIENFLFLFEAAMFKSAVHHLC